MNINFSLFIFWLLYNIVCRSLDAEKNNASILQSAFCYCVLV